MQPQLRNKFEDDSVVFHKLSTDVPAPIGHYSHAAELPNGIVAMSGIKAWKVGKGTQIDGDVREQALLIFRHLDSMLSALALKREDVFRISVHLDSVDDYDDFNSCYSEWLGSHRPARTVLAGYRLRGGAKLELVVDAYRSDTSESA